MGHSNSKLPASDHFELRQLADGVFAAIAIEGGAAFSNAGIINLGDQTLIFDTFDTPRAAFDLKTAAEQLAGQPASAIIISHAHDDHWLGNQVFPEQIPILATHKTRQVMIEAGEEMRELQDNPSWVEDDIREFEESLKIERDDRKRKSLEISILRYRYALEALPTLEIRLANQTFDSQFTFHGTRRTAKLLTQGSGHTESDCYLILPDEKIMFMGDLGFFQCQPFMASSDPEAWKAQLEEMDSAEMEVFVPGHGPLGTKADIALQVEYITTLENMVDQVVKDGGTVEDAVEQPLPEPFDAWLSGGMARFESNARFFYERLSGE